MRHWIITLSLAALLIGGGVFCGIKIVDMTGRIDELESNYTTLESNYDSLTSDYQSLTSNYNSLDSDYRSLQSNYSVLQSDYQSLESNYESLSSEYNTLQGRISELQYSNGRLQDEIDDLQRLLDQYEKVPQSYYSTATFPHHSNTTDALLYFLSKEFALPRDYQANIFDCSESAAYLEWALENAGFEAKIAVGPTPWDPTSGYHAWVIANTVEYTVAIEATALSGEYHSLSLFTLRPPGIIYGDDPLIPEWRNYYESYDNLFQNIYHAIRNRESVEEWNWWEGYWGFQ